MNEYLNVKIEQMKKKSEAKKYISKEKIEKIYLIIGIF